MEHNLYIHSKNKSDSDKPYDFTLILNNHIQANKNQYIQVCVCNFYMLNTMYNISAIIGNNTFDIRRTGLDGLNPVINTYTIPDGNYSVLTLRDTINNLLSGIASITYNYANNTYTYKLTNIYYKYYIENIKCSKALGIYNTKEITIAGITGNYVNMIEYQQIIIKTDLIHSDLNQDNICYKQDDVFNISQILLWVNKQDVEPYRCISYDNNDTFTYNLINTSINKIKFTVHNENNNLITDCPDWFLHLKFKIVDKENNLIKSVLRLLGDIKYILYNIFFAYIRNKDGTGDV